MVFYSPEFLLFLAITFLFYYQIPYQKRWLVLLAASYLFYCFLGVAYLPLLLALVTGLTYFVGLKIDERKTELEKKRWLRAGIIANVLILVVFRYGVFLIETSQKVTTWFAGQVVLQSLEPLVTIGLSFYVFQAISYLVDVYFETTGPEKHFGIFALYMAFFAKLLQGPIERADRLIPQLRKPYRLKYEDLRAGALLFSWGMFKKIVIADRLKIYIDQVYGNVSAYQGANFLLTILFYSVFIYCDFSGYTDMALGAARVFGIHLTQNFRRPYWAKSIPEFWRRWHISLSTWLQDYIFTPLHLQWRKQKELGIVGALLVTFFVSGFWHGAGWTFITWGIVFGLMMVVSVLAGPTYKKLENRLHLNTSPIMAAVKITFTFLLVSFAWVFFGTKSVSDALYVITNLFGGVGDTVGALISGIGSLGQRQGLLRPIILSLSYFDLVILTLAIPAWLLVEYVTEYRPQVVVTFHKSVLFRWVVYLLLAGCIAFLGMQAEQQFVYFRF